MLPTHKKGTTMNRHDRPDYNDVMSCVQDVASSCARATVRRLGRSVQDRDIPCVIFSDPAVPQENKQRALILASQHGSEESGRAIVIALMRHLTSGHEEAQTWLRHQEIAVLPCCNPDGAQAGTYRNANDVDTAHDFPFDSAPKTPESACIEPFAMDFAPEMIIDIHGMAGGSMHDRVWMTPVPHFSVNRYFATMMAEQATRSAEDAGYPFCEIRPPRDINNAKSATHLLGEKLSFEMNTLSFGIEAIEHYYTEKEWCEAGMLRLRALLSHGCSDAFNLGATGYPNSLISGFRLSGLWAHGKTAARRRESRKELTKYLRENFIMATRAPDGLERKAKLSVTSKTFVGKTPERFRLSVRLKKPAQITSVTWDGQALHENNSEHGYEVLERQHDLQVMASLCAPLGGPDRALEVHYRSPLFGNYY
jgi:hypothetical protein